MLQVRQDELRPCKVWRYSPGRCRVGGGVLHGSDGKSSPCALRHARKDRTELVSFSLALGGPFLPGLNLREGGTAAGGGGSPALRDRKTSGDTVYSFKGDTPSRWVEVSNGRGTGLTLALPRPFFTLKAAYRRVNRATRAGMLTAETYDIYRE